MSANRVNGSARWWLLGAGVLVALAAVAAWIVLPRPSLGEGLKITDLPAGVRAAVLMPDPDSGEPAYRLRLADGRMVWLGAGDYAARLHADYGVRPLSYRAMNINSPVGMAWVGLGLAGQLLFTGRMLVQWLASERRRRSVVPVAFWWMSLVGATMLLLYFIWRQDIVGVLGQATGWFIYVRNLWLIHRPRAPNDAGEDAAAADQVIADNGL
jgi:lipid-A-disaccharide synthase-like uncharacterized protein